jgi:hypothetical protein
MSRTGIALLKGTRETVSGTNGTRIVVTPRSAKVCAPRGAVLQGVGPSFKFLWAAPTCPIPPPGSSIARELPHIVLTRHRTGNDAKNPHL